MTLLIAALAIAAPNATQDPALKINERLLPRGISADAVRNAHNRLSNHRINAEKALEEQTNQRLATFNSELKPMRDAFDALRAQDSKLSNFITQFDAITADDFRADREKALKDLFGANQPMLRDAYRKVAAGTNTKARLAAATGVNKHGEFGGGWLERGPDVRHLIKSQFSYTAPYPVSQTKKYASYKSTANASIDPATAQVFTDVFGKGSWGGLPSTASGMVGVIVPPKSGSTSAIVAVYYEYSFAGAVWPYTGLVSLASYRLALEAAPVDGSSGAPLGTSKTLLESVSSGYEDIERSATGDSVAVMTVPLQGSSSHLLVTARVSASVSLPVSGVAKVVAKMKISKIEVTYN